MPPAVLLLLLGALLVLGAAVVRRLCGGRGREMQSWVDAGKEKSRPEASTPSRPPDLIDSSLDIIDIIDIGLGTKGKGLRQRLDPDSVGDLPLPRREHTASHGVAEELGF